MSFKVPEQFREPHLSTPEDGCNGMFRVPLRGTLFLVIASDGAGWEHVSVSSQRRPPTWGEMCSIKDLFWDAEDCVMQLHPPRSEWINNHHHCLHLWRPNAPGVEIPRPAGLLVGIKGLRI